jgi:hypothetical protein
MPLGDWQFWIVTALFAAGTYVVARPFLPWRKRGKSGGACPNCAAGSAAGKRKKVALTVDRKRV